MPKNIATGSRTRAKLAHTAGAYIPFCSISREEVLLLPLDGIQVHRRLLPSILSGFPNSSPGPIYTPSTWREAMWELIAFPNNTT